MVQHTGAPHWMYPKRKFAGSKELLKLQAEGKIISPLTPAAAKWVYNSVASAARPRVPQPPQPQHSDDVDVEHGLQLSHRNE